MNPPDYIRAAQLEVYLMREFLAKESELPSLEDCVWIENVPVGYNAESVRRLQRVQEHYGTCHVTTGNAQPLTTGLCGIYVRESAYEDAPNLLRAYLSQTEKE